MPRTRWTPWTGPCWMAVSSVCRWLATAARPTRTTAGVGRRRAATGAVATAAAAAALEDAVAADLEAGAALDPAVGPATVGLNPALAHGLGLVPPRSPGLPGDPSQSPRLSPDPGPGQDPDPDLEALPLRQRGNPTLDPDLRALPSLRKKKELCLLRLMMHQINANPHKGRLWGEKRSLESSVPWREPWHEQPADEKGYFVTFCLTFYLFKLRLEWQVFTLYVPFRCCHSNFL